MQMKGYRHLALHELGSLRWTIQEDKPVEPKQVPDSLGTGVCIHTRMCDARLAQDMSATSAGSRQTPGALSSFLHTLVSHADVVSDNNDDADDANGG